MKNIFKVFNLEVLKKNLKKISSRFSITVAIIVMVAILFFTQLHYHSYLTQAVNENMGIAILSLIITFVFSIWTYLSCENIGFRKNKRNLFQLIPIVFGVCFFFTFNSDIDDFENIIFFILSLIGMISYLFFAPYLNNIKKEQEIFYTYFYNISTTILISFILGWILFVLWAIWITAVDALFNLNIDSAQSYGNWAILSLSIITPLFALTQIPKKSELKKDNFDENRFFSFLIQYIAVPFIVVYFLILYAYSIKVLLNFWDWPKWEVSWMVIWFSIFGYATYIFSYIFQKENTFITKFRIVFPYIVVPQICMLFYAIYLRIEQYDITINRYFVVAFWIWLLIISLYYIFSKKKYLSLIPAILTLFTIIISIWPWSVYSLPESRQFTRLTTHLKEANILQNGKIISLKSYWDISQDLSKNIYSWIDYMCDFDNCKKMKELFPEIYTELLKQDEIKWKGNQKRYIEQLQKEKNFDTYYTKADSEEKIQKEKERVYEWPDTWNIVQKITETIKVKNYFNTSDNNQKYIRYSRDYKESIFPLDINGYSDIYMIQSSEHYDTRSIALYKPETSVIEIQEKWIVLETISTKSISEELQERALWKVYDTNDVEAIKHYWMVQDWLPKDELTFELQENNKTYKLYFENIAIKNPNYQNSGDGSISNYYTSWYILVR